MKILGIGWAKTGTTSLAECLKILGYCHKSQDLDLTERWGGTDWDLLRQAAEPYETFEDWPWLLLYREFDQWFPGTRFVLTRRDEQAWLRSYRNQLSRVSQGARDSRIRSLLYGLPFPDVTDEQLLARYRKHNVDAVAYFADRPGDLLVVDWTKGDGWAELCAFLGKPVPDIPFPNANTAPSRTVQALKNIRWSGTKALGKVSKGLRRGVDRRRA